ncbi:MAG: phosphoribosylanthranilate isomerase [Methylococcales bacterium]|jgi:phosphoribosylanthranilate isomerase|nr:phosphoribosylanthranilate isomerase [Methylococcales bacterium]
MRTRLKVCGITNPDDAINAVNAGVDAIGLVFYEKSPRSVTIEQARCVVNSLPPFVTVVGLFVNESAEIIKQILDQVSLDILQFHGDELADFCQQFNTPYMKAIRMKSEVNYHKMEADYQAASGLLLDTYQKGIPGGTGETFNWSLIPSVSQRKKPIILAGGLTPENVKIAIETVKPFAVDVSGGVEKNKGLKSQSLMKSMMNGVMNARP